MTSYGCQMSRSCDVSACRKCSDNQWHMPKQLFTELTWWFVTLTNSYCVVLWLVLRVCDELFVSNFFRVWLSSTIVRKTLWATQWNLVCFSSHKPMSLCFFPCRCALRGLAIINNFDAHMQLLRKSWVLNNPMPDCLCMSSLYASTYMTSMQSACTSSHIGHENTSAIMVMVRLTMWEFGNPSS